MYPADKKSKNGKLRILYVWMRPCAEVLMCFSDNEAVCVVSIDTKETQWR